MHLPCRDGRVVEGVNGRAIVARERDVNSGAGFAPLGPEVGLASAPEPSSRNLVLHKERVSEGRERFLEEALASLVVRDN